MADNGLDWSPADNPYAIAVSEAQWWRSAVRLTILRMRGVDDRRLGWFSSRQIDARQLIIALRQLQVAAKLEEIALEELGMDSSVRAALQEARERFEAALPGLKDMRDGLMHAENWSRGMGRGPQAKARKSTAARDVARMYWGFGYESGTGTVSFGPYKISVEAAEQAANALSDAVCQAAGEVDRRNVAVLREAVLELLASGGVTSGQLVRVSPGTDMRIWISLDYTALPDAHERAALAEQVANLVEGGRLELVSPNTTEDVEMVERLSRGELLYVLAKE